MIHTISLSVILTSYQTIDLESESLTSERFMLPTKQKPLIVNADKCIKYMGSVGGQSRPQVSFSDVTL